MKQTINKIAITVLIVTLIAACSAKKEAVTKTEIAKEDNVITAYLTLKNALVATDAAQAKAAATKFLAINKNEAFHEPLTAINANDDIKAQRAAFEQLSIHLYDFVKANGHETVLYKQYCPMAFNNKGAFWLASEEEVNNPYFGDMMLHCGSVQEVLVSE